MESKMKILAQLVEKNSNSVWFHIYKCKLCILLNYWGGTIMKPKHQFLKKIS